MEASPDDELYLLELKKGARQMTRLVRRQGACAETRYIE